MNAKLLIATILTMSVASTVAVGCGSSDASNDGSSAGAVVLDEQDTSSSRAVGIMAGTQSDFLRTSILPSNWLKSPLIKDVGFDWDGIVPKGIEIELASGAWSADPVSLSLAVKDVVKDKSFTLEGTSRDGKVRISSTISVAPSGDDKLEITIDSTASVRENPAGARALAKASDQILQVFDADLQAAAD
jgi:hypothetical protein